MLFVAYDTGTLMCFTVGDFVVEGWRRWSGVFCLQTASKAFGGYIGMSQYISEADGMMWMRGLTFTVWPFGICVFGGESPGALDASRVDSLWLLLGFVGVHGGSLRKCSPRFVEACCVGGVSGSEVVLSWCFLVAGDVVGR